MEAPDRATGGTVTVICRACHGAIHVDLPELREAAVVTCDCGESRDLDEVPLADGPLTRSRGDEGTPTVSEFPADGEAPLSEFPS